MSNRKPGPTDGYSNTKSVPGIAGGHAASPQLRVLDILVDPKTLAKRFKFNRRATEMEASECLFGNNRYARAIAPDGFPPTDTYSLITHDMSAVMSLRPAVLQAVISASVLTSAGKPYEMPAWVPQGIQEQVRLGKLPRGASRFNSADPAWGDIVVWRGNTAYEMYQQFPDDPGFYRNIVDDARTARLLHWAYTQFNRDMEYFVFEKGMEPELARSEIRRINDEVFKLVLEGVMTIMVSGAGIAQVGNAMRANAGQMARAAERSPRFRSMGKIRPAGGKVNVGGGFETPEMTNLNPCNPSSGGPSHGIPNHVSGGMEEMGEIFEAGSVDYMMSSKLRFNDVDWNKAARAAASAMRRGGKVEMNVWCDSGEAEKLVIAFQAAGFSDVRTIGEGVGTMLSAVR
jgi:hypothetical protein